MKTQMGEYIVGAYLKEILNCDVVDFNVRPPTTGLEGLAEFDVIGLRFSDKVGYICEVTTHLDGVKYGDNKTTFERIRKKFERQKWYAKKFLSDFDDIHLMFWAPIVREGYLTKTLQDLNGLELIINKRYAECVDEIRDRAKKTTRDVGNPFFRALQILEHLRE